MVSDLKKSVVAISCHAIQHAQSGFILPTEGRVTGLMHILILRFEFHDLDPSLTMKYVYTFTQQYFVWIQKISLT